MPVVYDLEVFPNVFTATFKPIDGGRGRIFEISDRRNDSDALRAYLETLTYMIGFNNLGFDWPIVNFFLENPGCTAADLYRICCSIIGSEDRFAHIIWEPAIPQIDLFKIHHFDNPAKSTSLKKLEFNMRSELVQDLPFPVGVPLTYAEIDTLIAYNCHDVCQTEKFFWLSQDKIKQRQDINPAWINQSDTGLGRKYFERALLEAGVWLKKGGTPRPDGVDLGDVIFPYVQFKTPVLQEALDFFKRMTVTEVEKEIGGRMKTVRTGLVDGKEAKEYTFELDGLTVTMALGGLHASRESVVVEGVDIEDLDVTSFYPSISIVNRIFPEHLGPIFCDVYANLKTARLTYPKGTSENKTLKDALNSVFGSAGSKYTNFYDPKFLLAITINGQFLILSLAELVLSVPGVRILQINTDGITIVIPDGARPRVKELCDIWSKATLLDLESNAYTKMWLRDVNNYIAQYTDGKRKRKGVYERTRQWHQNQSMPVIRAAAEAAMCDGVDVEDYISANDINGFDFMLRLDLTKTSRLILDDGREVKGVVRYYVSPEGNKAVKHMPATQTRIHGSGHATCSGKRGSWVCSECGEVFKTKGVVSGPGSKEEVRTETWAYHNDVMHSSKLVLAQRYNGEPINYDMRFYAGEARKLLITERFVP
jgi:hypothetical protein